MSRPLTILFWPEAAYGPTNQCIGLGRVLLAKGHRVAFAAESSWEGKLAPFGFEEHLVDLAAPDPDAGDEDAGAFWANYIAETKPEFRKPTIEQIETFVKPTYQALIDGAMYCEPRLREIVAQVKPDVIVEDNVVLFPALVTAGVPFIRVVSCNPLEITGDGIAPALSGLAQAEPESWGPWRAAAAESLGEQWEAFNAWCQANGAPALPHLEYMPRDNAANIYVYPEAADYVGERPLDDTWHRIESSVRDTDDDYVVPAHLADRPEDSALIYLSLGSLGGADVELMQKLIDALADSKHKFIVSKGPVADQITLAANMDGDAIVPQTKIIPQVDLVITHGGNNTTTESLHFGKPMVLLPLFWDQYDNAQRMDELGFGVRLPTYEWTPEDLHDAIDRLLADHDLRARLAAIGEQIRASDGVTRGAEVIEAVGLAHQSA